MSKNFDLIHCDGVAYLENYFGIYLKLLWNFYRAKENYFSIPKKSSRALHHSFSLHPQSLIDSSIQTPLYFYPAKQHPIPNKRESGDPGKYSEEARDSSAPYVVEMPNEDNTENLGKKLKKKKTIARKPS